MAEPDTVTAATQLLYKNGYKADVRLVDGELHFDRNGTICPAVDAVVERMYRFEGPSDPGDEMVVFAVFDPVSGRRGTLAMAYGPAADPDAVEHLTYLADHVESR